MPLPFSGTFCWSTLYMKWWTKIQTFEPGIRSGLQFTFILLFQPCFLYCPSTKTLFFSPTGLVTTIPSLLCTFLSYLGCPLSLLLILWHFWLQGPGTHWGHLKWEGIIWRTCGLESHQESKCLWWRAVLHPFHGILASLFSVLTGVFSLFPSSVLEASNLISLANYPCPFWACLDKEYQVTGQFIDSSLFSQVPTLNPVSNQPYLKNQHPCWCLSRWLGLQ